MLGSSLVAAQMEVSRKGLSSMKLLYNVFADLVEALVFK
jgi:hypothetical protein